MSGENENVDIIQKFDDMPLKGEQVIWTTLLAFGDYLDAGALVAGAVSAVYWESYFHIGLVFIGLIFGLRQFGMWGGSLIAGPIGDRYGRKTIFTYDLILYAVGALIIAISTNLYEMIFSYIFLSIAIGIDVPTTWSLIAEFSPKKNRGGLTGFTNIFWYIGPIVVILIAVGTFRVGIDVFRIVFGSLALVAIGTWFLRRNISESPRWAIQNGKKELIKESLKYLGVKTHELDSISPISQRKWKWTSMFKYWKGLVLVIPLYILWGIPASTYGSFLPYFIKNYAKATIFSSYIGTVLWFGTAIIALLLVYIPLADRINRRVMYSISSAIIVVSFLILAIYGFSSINIVFFSIILFGVGQGMGLWPLTRLWSVEIFPTQIRNTAQGFVWSWNRLIVGFWTISLAFIISAISLKGLAIIFSIFFIITLIVGGIFGPDSHGKTLEKAINEFYDKGVE